MASSKNGILRGFRTAISTDAHSVERASYSEEMMREGDMQVPSMNINTMKKERKEGGDKTGVLDTRSAILIKEKAVDEPMRYSNH